MTTVQTVEETRFVVIDKYKPQTRLSWEEFMLQVHNTACKMRKEGIKEDVIDRKVKQLIGGYHGEMY